MHVIVSEMNACHSIRHQEKVFRRHESDEFGLHERLSCRIHEMQVLWFYMKKCIKII
jgi:hypothetical protein